MKKNYQNPETEIVLVGLSKLILQDDDPDNSGQIGNGDDGPGIVANESDLFDEDFTKGASGNLWDK
ncbi:MAG: hypothetical protein IKR05_08045 [Prevotella sp.]|nr:hypothetical protein [Prevotella sp.]